MDDDSFAENYSEITSPNDISETTDCPQALASIQVTQATNLGPETIKVKHERKKATSWTYEEEIYLNQLVNKYGHKWVSFTNYFPDKTVLQIKNRWYSNLRKDERRQNANEHKKRNKFHSPNDQPATFPKKTDNFWDEHLPEESFLQECMNIFYDMDNPPV